MLIFHSFLYVYQRVIAFQQVYKAVWASFRGCSQPKNLLECLVKQRFCVGIHTWNKSNKYCKHVFGNKQVVLLVPTCPAIKEPLSWQMAMLPDLMSVSSAHFGMLWLLYMQSFMVFMVLDQRCEVPIDSCLPAVSPIGYRGTWTSMSKVWK